MKPKRKCAHSGILSDIVIIIIPIIFTWPLSFPGVRVRFCGFHPGEREVISTLFSRVSVTGDSLQRLLLETLRVMELRHTWIISKAGEAVRADVRKAGLLQGSHGRRSVDGVNLSAHVEARWRAVAVVLPLWPLVGTGVFKNLRGVVVIFSIHGCRGPGAAGPLARTCTVSKSWLGADLLLYLPLAQQGAPHGSAQVCQSATMWPCCARRIGFTVCSNHQTHSSLVSRIFCSLWGCFSKLNRTASARKSMPICKYRNGEATRAPSCVYSSNRCTGDSVAPWEKFTSRFKHYHWHVIRILSAQSWPINQYMGTDIGWPAR